MLSHSKKKNTLLLIKLFNIQLNNFVDDLLIIYKNDIDLKLFKLYIKKINNSTSIFNKFSKNIDKNICNQIILKNEKFFKENNKNFYLFQKINKKWDNLEKKNKDIFWQYLISLVNIHNRFINA